MAISTPGSHDFARGRALPDESFVNDDDEDDDEEEDTDGEGDSGIDASFIAKLTSKKRKGGRDDDDDDDDEDEFGNKVRRSKRATKGKKLEFWKGERVVYDRGQMIGVLTANPTPAKPKRPKQSGGILGRKNNNNKGSKKGSGRGGKSSEDDNNNEGAKHRSLCCCTAPKCST
jgi:hypothetical protein